MDISVIFSILFSLECVISIILGIYVIQDNVKSYIGRLFFAITASLSIWSLGLAASISAIDMDTFIIWRRISAIGWGTIFSFMLHFVLLLTGKKGILKKWWIYLGIYVPCVVNIFAFAIPTGTGFVPYNPIKTPMGFINVSGNRPVDIFYCIYYFIFFIISMILVYKWGRNSFDRNVKKQSSSIIFSFTIAFVIGVFTDSIANKLSLGIPQMAPIIMLVPTIVLFYIMRKYGMLFSKSGNEDQLILNKKSRSYIYHFMCFGFIGGSLINLIIRFFTLREIPTVPYIYLSIFLLCMAVFVEILNYSNMDDSIKNMLIIGVFAVIVPGITLCFANEGGTTIWAYAFVLIIISLLFNQNLILLAIIYSSILTEIIIWSVSPYVVVHIDRIDYMVRIGLLIISAFFALYVNKMYVLKLKESSNKINFQKLISEISSDFVSINISNLDEKIHGALKLIGEFLRIDRAYVFLLIPGKKKIRYINRWYDEKSGSYVSIKLLYKLMDNFISKGIFKISGDESERHDILVDENIRSLILIPIKSEGYTVGFLGLDSSKTIQNWNQEYINLINIISSVISDTIRKIDAEMKIYHMAYYDQLTGLANRILFKDKVDKVIKSEMHSKNIFAIMYMDMDSFKSINNTMGHYFGDELLKKVAENLYSKLKPYGIVSRFGGDEFVIMINNAVDKKQILNIADKVITSFNNPFIIRGQEFFVTVSGGIAIYGEDGNDTETLIKNADNAMYDAKNKGKNQYRLCSLNLKDELTMKSKMTHFLYQAQKRKELEVYYQPQVNIESGKIIGLEALLRWNSQEFGMVSPGTFIPLAEQTGLINPIGEWVLETACNQNKLWQDMGLEPVKMAVNISVSQFRNPKFVHKINNTLEKTEMDAKYLELEITESVLIHEDDYIVKALKKLKKLGLTISIDDFGTEYSSLGRLKQLPIDRIKMDMQFVRGIDGSYKDRAITKVIISLAKNLGIKVIAEGVENKNQLDFLSEKMCDEVQGFYYYKPMSANKIEQILKNNV